MKKKILIILIIIPTILLLYWIFSIIKCEVLTCKYKNVINDPTNVADVHETIGEYNFAKVISSSKNEIRVYYIEKDYSYANTIIYRKTGNQWRVYSWDKCVWSSVGGSADDTVWPYWWHVFYFL